MSETPPATIDQYTPEDLFRLWSVWKQRATEAIAIERAIRAEVVRRWFPAPKEGANNVEIMLDGVERKLTLTQPVERKVLEPELLALIQQVAESNREQAGKQLPPVHPLGMVNFDKLIRRKPELATTEYRNLTDVQKAYFETALAIKDGSPQVELKPLKTK